MINHVVVAGRILEDPRGESTASGGRRAELVLEVEHVPKWRDGVGETCRVRARVFGDRRAEVVERYLRKGRQVSLTGHLRQDADGQLVVVVDQFDFLPDDLRNRCLWVDAPAPAPAGAGAGTGVF